MSFADAGGWGHVGYVYQATNFIYTGLTKRRTDRFSMSGHARHNSGDSSLRQLRTEKHRYIFITGSKRQREELEGQLRFKRLPYPKGNSRRYDPASPKPLVDLGLIGREEAIERICDVSEFELTP